MMTIKNLKNWHEPKLKTHGLIYFVCLAKHQDFRLAAQELGISYQALYQNIKQLEQALQVSLVRRHSKHKLLTDYGEKFLETAQALLHGLTDLQHKLQSDDFFQQTQSHLNIGWIGIWVPYLLPPLLKGLCDKFINLDLNISYFVSPERLEEAIHKGVIDLGLSLKPPQNPQRLVCHILSPVPYLIVASPRAKSPWQSLVYGSRPTLRSHPQVQGLQSWDEQAYPRQIVLRSNSMEQLIQACLAGVCAIHVPTIAVQKELDKGLLVEAADPPQAFSMSPVIMSQAAAYAGQEHLQHLLDSLVQSL